MKDEDFLFVLDGGTKGSIKYLEKAIKESPNNFSHKDCKKAKKFFKSLVSMIRDAKVDPSSYIGPIATLVTKDPLTKAFILAARGYKPEQTTEENTESVSTRIMNCFCCCKRVNNTSNLEEQITLL
jgi:hypothetical protein